MVQKDSFAGGGEKFGGGQKKGAMCSKEEVITNRPFLGGAVLPSRLSKSLYAGGGGQRRPPAADRDFNWCSRGESLDCSRNSKCYFASSRVWNTHNLLDSALSRRPQVRSNLLPPETHLRRVPGWCCRRCPPTMRSRQTNVSCVASHMTCFPGERNEGRQSSISRPCKIKNK